MRRIAKLEIYETPDGWTVRYALEGEPVRETRGWRSLLTALDQIGKVICQKVVR